MRLGDILTRAELQETCDALGELAWIQYNLIQGRDLLVSSLARALIETHINLNLILTPAMEALIDRARKCPRVGEMLKNYSPSIQGGDSREHRP